MGDGSARWSFVWTGVDSPRMEQATNQDSGYTAKISFDADGFVVDYEDFLKRIASDRLPAAGIDA
jgi:hypothetical protein